MTSQPVVAEPQDVLTDCIYIGIIEKVCDSLAECKQEAKISAREVNATHIVWIEVKPKSEQRPAYLKSSIFKCD